MDFHKLDQVVISISGAVLMWFHCLSKLRSPLLPGMELLSWQMHFSPSLSIRPTRCSLFSACEGCSTPLPSYFRYINSPSLCHHLFSRDLDHLFLPQAITLVHYTDDIMLIGPSEQEVATSLDLLIRCLLV